MIISLQRFRVVVGGVLVLALAALVGCGGGGKKKAPILSGKVTYKGEPVTGGTLTLTPSDTKIPPFNGNIDGKGNYSIVPPAEGEMKVTIETESIHRQIVYNRPDIDQSKMTKYVAIPRKYANVQSSGLSVNIQPGKNPKDFDLTD